ncbi:MAG: 3'-5' exonuclease [Halofilum sp. (in: g-proteobacteria)]|nr:3'-5' exonuclease [Halofilum sp. (in: g-proteobacteria)]
MDREPLLELADRALAACNRLLGRQPPDGRRTPPEYCTPTDTAALLATPVDAARYVVIDTETTGFGAYAGDEIVQIALLEYRGLEPTGQEYCTLVRPARPIPATATEIHGIDDNMVKDAPTIGDVIDDVLEFLGAAALVGHHLAFDLRFLNRVLQREFYCRLPQPTIDTMLLYFARSGRLGHYELDEIAAACRVPLAGRHDARGDAVIAGRIFAHLAAPLAAADGTVGDLIAATRDGAARTEPPPPA